MACWVCMWENKNILAPANTIRVNTLIQTKHWKLFSLFFSSTSAVCCVSERGKSAPTAVLCWVCQKGWLVFVQSSYIWEADLHVESCQMESCDGSTVSCQPEEESSSTLCLQLWPWTPDSPAGCSFHLSQEPHFLSHVSVGESRVVTSIMGFLMKLWIVLMFLLSVFDSTVKKHGWRWMMKNHRHTPPPL